MWGTPAVSARFNPLDPVELRQSEGSLVAAKGMTRGALTGRSGCEVLALDTWRGCVG